MQQLPPTRPEPSGSREKILEVAEALFARRGFAGVGMREVAADVGLGKSSLFHHFRSKAQLYYEVLERVLGRIRVRLDAALARSDDPQQRVEAWVDALVDALAEHPTSARLLLRGLFEDLNFGDAPAPEARASEGLVIGILQQIDGLLRDGVARGAFRAVAVPDMVQTLIGATVYHFASGELGEGVLGGPLFGAESVRRRKHELRNLLRVGLAPAAQTTR